MALPAPGSEGVARPSANGRAPDPAALQREVRTMLKSGTPVERAFARVGLAHAGMRGPVDANSLRNLPADVAQAVLEARGKTNEEISKMWSESMAKIARLNKQASEKHQIQSGQQRSTELKSNDGHLALLHGKRWNFGLPR